MYISILKNFGIALDLYDAVTWDAVESIDELINISTANYNHDTQRFECKITLEIDPKPESLRKLLIRLSQMKYDNTGTVGAVYELIKQLKEISPEDFGVVRNGKDIAIHMFPRFIISIYGSEYEASYELNKTANVCTIRYTPKEGKDGPDFFFIVNDVENVVEYTTTDHGVKWVCGTPIWQDTTWVFTGERGERCYVY